MTRPDPVGEDQRLYWETEARTLLRRANSLSALSVPQVAQLALLLRTAVDVTAPAPVLSLIRAVDNR